MSTDDPPSITSLAHERGEDGDPLPVEREIEIEGRGTYTVEVYPATSGERNTWQRRLQEEGDELSSETEAELLDAFAAHEPAEFNGADTWMDVRPAVTDAVGEVIMAELFDVPEDQFFEALDEWSGEAAREGN
jgi:Mlc titration factor MtfA (ptsG expression regulator)